MAPMNLAGLSDIARALGVSRGRAYQWEHLAGFPAPVVELRMGKLYDLEEVRAWRALRGVAPSE